MTEKKFTGRLNGSAHAFKRLVCKRFVLSAMKSFYPDVFLKVVKNSYSGEGTVLLPEEMDPILNVFLKKAIPDFMELYAADGNCVRSSALGYVSLSAQQVINGGFIGRA